VKRVLFASTLRRGALASPCFPTPAQARRFGERPTSRSPFRSRAASTSKERSCRRAGSALELRAHVRRRERFTTVRTRELDRLGDEGRAALREHAALEVDVVFEPHAHVAAEG